MPTIKIDLVHFQSLEDDDPVVKWLNETGFWDEEVRLRCGNAKKNLPLDLETRFHEEFGLPLTGPVLRLFQILMNDSSGVKLKEIGHTPESWKDPETCTGRLNHLKLVRVQDRILLKPLSIAFDPRVQFLIGARTSPYA